MLPFKRFGTVTSSCDARRGRLEVGVAQNCARVTQVVFVSIYLCFPRGHSVLFFEPQPSESQEVFFLKKKKKKKKNLSQLLSAEKHDRGGLCVLLLLQKAHRC